MHRKPRTINFATLSEESKQYIRDQHKSIGKKQMMDNLRVSHKTISDFMKEEGLQGRYAKKGFSNINVNQPKPEAKTKKRSSGKFDMDEFARFYK